MGLTGTMGHVWSLIRLTLVLLTNLYSIPPYCVWLIILWPVRVLLPDWYWKLEVVLFKGMLSVAASWFSTGGYRIIETGDDVSSLHDEEALLLINHQSTGDVPVLMAAFNDRDLAGGKLFWIMDDMFKFTHFGIASTVRNDVFIKEGKAARAQQLVLFKQHLVTYYRKLKRKWIVLFPEGGFLYKRIESNKRFAEKNNLPVWKHIALPRLGAVKIILDTLVPKDSQNQSTISGETTANQALKYVIDITVAYPKGCPLTMLEVAMGKKAGHTTMLHYRAYPISDIPRGEEGMIKWLYTLFAEKEHMLDKYYHYGTSLSKSDTESRILPRKQDADFSFNPMNVVLWHLFYIVSFCLHVAYVWKPLLTFISSCFSTVWDLF